MIWPTFRAMPYDTSPVLGKQMARVSVGFYKTRADRRPADTLNAGAAKPPPHQRKHLANKESAATTNSTGSPTAKRDMLRVGLGRLGQQAIRSC
jgi:hypothetical protein